MPNPEFKPENSFDSVENTPLRLLGTLFYKLPADLLPQDCVPARKSKTFHATVNSDIFRKNNVSNNICKGLFGSKKQRDLVIEVAPSTLSIFAYNTTGAKGNLEDEKGLFLLSSDGEHLRSHLRVADGKDENHYNRTRLREKNISIGTEDYVNIIKTVEEIAREQDIIK